MDRLPGSVRFCASTKRPVEHAHPDEITGFFPDNQDVSHGTNCTWANSQALCATPSSLGIFDKASGQIPNQEDGPGVIHGHREFQYGVHCSLPTPHRAENVLVEEEEQHEKMEDDEDVLQGAPR